MDDNLSGLETSAAKLPPVSPVSAEAFAEHSTDMLAVVNRLIEERTDLPELLNGNSVELLRDNHRNHANFMRNVFALNEFTMLARILPWVYNTYAARGVPFSYFPLELSAWQESVRAHLPAVAAAEVNRIYDWMLHAHPLVIRLAVAPDDIYTATDEWCIPFQQAFFRAILDGDQRRGLDAVEKARNAGAGLADLYMQVVQPSMYEVGRLWQAGRISVAHEHLASATVARLMAEMAPLNGGGAKKRRAVITSAPNEFHEIGPWMIADLLTGAGWDVRYLGANTPGADLLAMLKQQKPALLGISVTMPFNLDRAGEVISRCRAFPELDGMKIIIGGRALAETPGVYVKLGADAVARNAVEAVDIAAELCPEVYE